MTGTKILASRVMVVIFLASTVAAQDQFAGREKLRAHSNELRKDVIKVTDGVHVAVGYSASNAILIEGNNGSIIVDTLLNVADAKVVKAEFAKLSTAPVRAIIYTHFHPDHVGGARVFAGNDQPEIISHQLLVDRTPDIGRAGRDGGDQFGASLPDALFINAGVNPSVGRPPSTGRRDGFLPPTRTFTDAQIALTIAGVRLELIHTPGETNDAISVWLPDRRVLLPGDDFYRSFPNLYAIRGVRARPVDQWMTSLTRLIGLGAEHLVPSHTRPISGAAAVTAALTAYHDGIKSVLDQTLDGMQKGERPDELVEHVKLPPHLAGSPYLQEFYGTVPWAVRAIYTDYLGWFDGNPTRLFPLAEKERAAKIVALAGGASQVLSRARDALKSGEFQWSAELADYVLAIDGANVDAKRVKAQALSELGERQISANARNYYLSAAQFLLRDQPSPSSPQRLPYDAMAARIVAALQVMKGERVLLRVDPNNMAALAPLVEELLQGRGAIVERLPYGPAPDFEARLARTDVYVWLPAPATATPADQGRMLQRWIDNGEGRELHFHWIDGTRDVDGLPAQHTPAYDRVYVDALNIDYAQLGTRMEQAIQRLRKGEVRVTTPSGTDIRFRVGDRPFNKQDGDASKAHARTGRIRIDRHTELPAGILRVAPLEESVSGVLVLPSARFGAERAADVRLEFQKGAVTSASARSGIEAVQAFLKSDPGASRFREFCLGFNPRLVVPPGETALPYYGYGSGVVRMSLGDNSELGGAVRGNVVRWLFFPDATVSVGSDVIARDGKLLER